ncbi:MAG: hypothetical protein SGJ27_21565 [Candidatus Melainabacteria bacterium]|nr:hypothetical protein [Candidatus Melainabacteria bacterium]
MLDTESKQVNTDAKQIRIPFSNPQFNLIFLSMDSSNQTMLAAESIIDSYTEDKKDESDSKFWRLNSTDEKRFFNNLQHCNLSEVQTALCNRAQTVLNISSVRTGSSFFAPFWACHSVAEQLAELVDSICVDLYQGNAFYASSEMQEHRAADNIPLAGTFLTVKAYPKGNSNKFFLCTEGMARFGLPELTLTEVPSNLGADGAYLLRAVAQYLWSKLENIHPEVPYFSINETIEMPAVYCEYGNPAFHEADHLAIPFALEVFESKHETLLVVRPPAEYDDYYDWFLSVTESIVEHRLQIQRATTATSEEVLPAPISVAA